MVGHDLTEKLLTRKSNEFLDGIVLKNENSANIDDAKYALFCKWLKESESADVPALAKEMCGILETSDDEYMDPDEIENLVTPIVTPTPPDDHIYESLLTTSTNLLSVQPKLSEVSLNSSRGSSHSDLTSDGVPIRRSNAHHHNKGKAPRPPSDFCRYGEVARAAELSKTSRSKTFFNLLPSIFKPVSPASSNRNLHIETDI